MTPAPPSARARAGEDALALERRFPALAGRLDRVLLTTLPTPVAPLRTLGRAARIGDLWIKRDDASGALYGGNKPRKLEFVLGRVVRRGRRSVVTFGGLGTHHGLATTIAGRACGLGTILVLVPQPVTEHVRRNLLLDHAYGAELHLAPSAARAALTAVRLLARETLRGHAPALVPTGGTSAHGALGYVNAGLELAEQIRGGALPEPFAVFLPLGSGGTVAGLGLGLALAGLRTRVVGVLVTDILPPTTARLLRLARRSWRVLRRRDPGIPDFRLDSERLTIVTHHLGRGYGAVTPGGETARRLIAEREGIELESTYTAKALAALLELAHVPPYRGRPLLFWNTYSSVDPGARLPDLPDPRELPAAFHAFFAATGTAAF